MPRLVGHGLVAKNLMRQATSKPWVTTNTRAMSKPASNASSANSALVGFGRIVCCFSRQTTVHRMVACSWQRCQHVCSLLECPTVRVAHESSTLKCSYKGLRMYERCDNPRIMTRRPLVNQTKKTQKDTETLTF